MTLTYGSSPTAAPSLAAPSPFAPPPATDSNPPPHAPPSVTVGPSSPPTPPVAPLPVTISDSLPHASPPLTPSLFSSDSLSLRPCSSHRQRSPAPCAAFFVTVSPSSHPTPPFAPPPTTVNNPPPHASPPLSPSTHLSSPPSPSPFHFASPAPPLLFSFARTRQLLLATNVSNPSLPCRLQPLLSPFSLPIPFPRLQPYPSSFFPSPEHCSCCSRPSSATPASLAAIIPSYPPSLNLTTTAHDHHQQPYLPCRHQRPFSSSPLLPSSPSSPLLAPHLLLYAFAETLQVRSRPPSAAPVPSAAISPSSPLTLCPPQPFSPPPTLPSFPSSSEHRSCC